jgi:uncharacterized Zn-binding protein involved in type VI secretion
VAYKKGETYHTGSSVTYVPNVTGAGLVVAEKGASKCDKFNAVKNGAYNRSYTYRKIR